MNLLLETHGVLWCPMEPARLTGTLRELLRNAPDQVLVSHVSLRELAVTRSAGMLQLDVARCAEQVAATGFEWLPITSEHIIACDAMVVGLDHRDTFDRQLVAQAGREAPRLRRIDSGATARNLPHSSADRRPPQLRAGEERNDR
jgi:PIN domain nuclease of toxin-antitoxin system